MPATINRAAFAAARRRLAWAPRAGMQAVAADLVTNTPVITGQLRAAWTVSVDGVAVDGAPAAPDPGGEATVARLQAAIAAAPDGAKVSFRNLASYCGFVEFGTAKMAPRAFIRGTIARMPIVMREALTRGAPEP